MSENPTPEHPAADLAAEHLPEPSETITGGPVGRAPHSRQRIVGLAVLVSIVAGMVALVMVAASGPGALPDLAYQRAGRESKAVPSSAAFGAPSADASYPNGPAHYRYVGAKTQVPTKAPAYRLGVATKADAQRLAKAFGVSGAVEETPEGFRAVDATTDPGHCCRIGQAVRALFVAKVAGGRWNLGPNVSVCDLGRPVPAVGAPSGVAGDVVVDGCAVREGGAGSGGNSGSSGSGSTSVGSAGDSDTTGPPVTTIPGGGSSSPGGGQTCAPPPPCADGTQNCAHPDVCLLVPSDQAPSQPILPDPSGVTTCSVTGAVEARGIDAKTPASEVPTTRVVEKCGYEVPARPADLPTKEQAIGVARDLAAKTGVDLAGADVRAEDGFDTWIVTIAPKVDGMTADGVATTIAVGVKQVISWANGSVLHLDKLGDYPLVGIDVAVGRLNAGQQVYAQESYGGVAYATGGAVQSEPVPGPDRPITVEGAGGGCATTAACSGKGIEPDPNSICPATGILRKVGTPTTLPCPTDFQPSIPPCTTADEVTKGAVPAPTTVTGCFDPGLRGGGNPSVSCGDIATTNGTPNAVDPSQAKDPSGGVAPAMTTGPEGCIKHIPVEPGVPVTPVAVEIDLASVRVGFALSGDLLVPVFAFTVGTPQKSVPGFEVLAPAVTDEHVVATTPITGCYRRGGCPTTTPVTDIPPAKGEPTCIDQCGQGQGPANSEPATVTIAPAGASATTIP